MRELRRAGTLNQTSFMVLDKTRGYRKVTGAVRDGIRMQGDRTPMRQRHCRNSRWRIVRSRGAERDLGADAGVISAGLRGIAVYDQSGTSAMLSSDRNYAFPIGAYP